MVEVTQKEDIGQTPTEEESTKKSQNNLPGKKIQTEVPSTGEKAENVILIIWHSTVLKLAAVLLFSFVDSLILTYFGITIFFNALAAEGTLSLAYVTYLSHINQTKTMNQE